jgi:hypothetical protein
MSPCKANVILRHDMEVFVSAHSLRTTDAPRRECIDAFAVVSLRRADSCKFTELARTETCPATAAPWFYPSFVISHDDRDADLASLRVDIYHRRKQDSERLEDHEHFGKTTIPINAIRQSPGMHFTSDLLQPLRERQIVGVVTVHCEPVSRHPTANELVEIDVAVSVLRRREWPRHSIPQRFEILRAHIYDDTNGRTVWLPISCSNSASKQRDVSASKASHVEFSRVTVTKRQLCNGDEERRLRFVVEACLSGASSKKAHSGPRMTELGYIEVTMRDLCECDPSEEVFNMESDENPGDVVGNLFLLMSEPTDVGAHFSVQINHLTSPRYSSAYLPTFSPTTGTGSRIDEAQLGTEKQYPDAHEDVGSSKTSNGVPRSLTRIVGKTISPKVSHQISTVRPLNSNMLDTLSTTIQPGDEKYVEGNPRQTNVGGLNMWMTESLFTDENLQTPLYVETPKATDSISSVFQLSYAGNKPAAESLPERVWESCTPRTVHVGNAAKRPFARLPMQPKSPLQIPGGMPAKSKSFEVRSEDCDEEADVDGSSNSSSEAIPIDSIEDII